MTTPFGFVLQADTNFDKPRFEQHVKVTRPLSLTVINNPGYALHLKRNVIPNCNIYIRNIDYDGDGNDFSQFTPQSYFDKYGPLTEGILGIQISNEPQFTPALGKQMLPFLQEAVNRQIKVSSPGIAVGNTPSSADGWNQYHDLIDYICHHPFYITLDVHEYFAALPTSGMITVQTQPGEVLYFTTALDTPAKWQPKTLADFTNNYHVGRIRHLFDYARRQGWPAPVVDISEFGADFVKDNQTVENWLRSIPADGAPNIEGYQTLGTYWHLKFPQWTKSQTFYECLLWLWTNILKPAGVRSTRIFVWNDGSLWKNFNVSKDDALLLWLENYSLGTSAPAPIPPTKPPEPPKPTPPPFDEAQILATLKQMQITLGTLKASTLNLSATLDTLITQLAKD